MEPADVTPSPHLATVFLPDGNLDRQATIWHGGEDGLEDKFIVYALPDPDDPDAPEVVEKLAFDTLAEASQYAVRYVVEDVTYA